MLNRTCAIAGSVFRILVVLGVLKPFFRFQHRAWVLLAVSISGALLGERLDVHGGVLLDWWA